MPAAEVHDARPVLLVRDVVATLAYYRDRLGFQTESFGDPPDFGAAQRGGATLLFALASDASRIVPNWRVQANVWNVYVAVQDVDALYGELRERGATIDYEIYDAPHGFREFGIQDPDGYDIGFGQPAG